MRVQELKIDSFYATRTYGGCYMGIPSNQVMILGAIERTKKMWGEGRPTYVAPPPEGDSLPEWTYSLWLSAPAADPTINDGSHLFVILFSNSPPAKGFEVDQYVTKEIWTNFAQDYGI